MMDLSLSIDVAPDKSVLKHSPAGPPAPTTVHVKGLISRPVTGQGRATGSRQFFYINGRPFNPARIAKAFNEVYKQFNVGSYPCVVADFQLPTGESAGIACGAVEARLALTAPHPDGRC